MGSTSATGWIRIGQPTIGDGDIPPSLFVALVTELVSLACVLPMDRLDIGGLGDL